MFVLENKARFLAAAAGGFVVNWLGYVVIKTASSLTLKVGLPGWPRVLARVTNVCMNRCYEAGCKG